RLLDAGGDCLQRPLELDARRAPRCRRSTSSRTAVRLLPSIATAAPAARGLLLTPRLQHDRVRIQVVVTAGVYVLLVGSAEIANPFAADLENPCGELAHE